MEVSSFIIRYGLKAIIDLFILVNGQAISSALPPPIGGLLVPSIVNTDSIFDSVN